MVTIGVIGILSSALFPSLTSYLSRWRDTSRVAWIKEITTALAAYGIDKGNYPAVPPSGCIPAKDLVQYLPKIPTDPIVWRISAWCDGSDGMSYEYRIMKDGEWKDIFIIATELENINWWNSELSVDEILKLQDPSSKLYSLKRWRWNYHIIFGN